MCGCLSYGDLNVVRNVTGELVFESVRKRIMQMHKKNTYVKIRSNFVLDCCFELHINMKRCNAFYFRPEMGLLNLAIR